MTDLPLRDVEVVLTDTLIGAEKASAAGVPKGTRLISASPAVLMSSQVREHFEVSLPQTELFARLNPTTQIFCRVVAGALNAAGLEEGLVGAATRWSFLFANLVEKALYLSNEDYDKKAAVVFLSGLTDQDRETLNFPWPTLLSPNKRLRLVDAGSVPIPRQPLDGPDLGFMGRLRGRGSEHAAFGALRRLRFLLRHLPARGLILYQREPPLLKSAAVRFALMGYRLEALPMARTTESNSTLSEETELCLRSAVAASYGAIAPDRALQVLGDEYLRRLRSWLGIYSSSTQFWNNVLAPDRWGRTPNAVLTSLSFTAEETSLFSACRKLNIPLVSFQHGPARELNRLNRNADCYFEGASADHFVAFSPVAARISANSAFNIAKCHVAALPKVYAPRGSAKHTLSKQTVLYASSLLFTGTRRIAALAGSCDYDSLLIEQRVIDEILGKIPNRVLYKHYPHDLRYLDESPIEAMLAKHSNISVYRGRVDLLHFLPSASIVMVGGASSTAAWCILSDRPTLYLDTPTHRPLADDAREMIQQSAFLFDLSRDDTPAQIRDFLSLGYERIVRLWGEKEKQRERFMRDYLGLAHAGNRKLAAVVREIRASFDFGKDTGINQ